MIEKTAAGPQYVLAGASRAGDGEIARRRADAPLRASKAQQSVGARTQQPCDLGLFSDDARQLHICDLLANQIRPPVGM
jgi:hypothetical protein